jgi:hypothetical protein
LPVPESSPHAASATSEVDRAHTKRDFGVDMKVP